MKKFGIILTAASLVLVSALAGCGKKEDDKQGAGASPSPAAASPAASPAGGAGKGANFKIGMVTDVGGVNDKSFNQQAWEALQKLEKETGATVKYQQSKGDADFIPNLNTFVKDNYNLTWGIGFIIGDAMKDVALKNPNAKMAIIDNTVDAPNVKSITFAEHEGSYLVGVVAGLMTKTGTIGFVGGMDIPVIKRFEGGFKAGVLAANPNAKVSVNYTGAFDKPDIGKSAAATMYNSGADIIFHASGATGNGVFNEAKDRLKSGKKVWVIGVDKDQSQEFGTDVTLTSMMKYVDRAVFEASKALIDSGTFDTKPVTLGLKANGVGLPANNPNVPADVLKKVDEFKTKIINGEIKVPEM
jgi:basic membrane protein A and related proteins